MAEKGLRGRDDRGGKQRNGRGVPGRNGLLAVQVRTRRGAHTQRSPHVEGPTRRCTEKEANACVF